MTMVSKKEMQKQGLSSLFPCAAGVTMPLFGLDDVEMRKHLGKPAASLLSFQSVTVDSRPVDRRYLKKISNGMTFDESVVKERCFHMLPYDSKYLEEALDTSSLICSRPKTNYGYIPHGTSTRHMPCGVTFATKLPFLRPIQRKTTEKVVKARVEANKKATENVSSSRSISRSQTDVPIDCKETDRCEVDKNDAVIFMTEVNESESKLKQPETLENLNKQLKELYTLQAGDAEDVVKGTTQSEERKNGWYQYLLSQLSEVTATWMVHESMPLSKDQQRLAKTLEDWYGKPRTTDLIQEEISDSEEDENKSKDQEKRSKRKWKKKEASLLEQVYQISGTHSALDPYSDDNKAPFYRQPAGIRRKRKSIEKEEGAVNATAHKVKLPEIKQPAPPTLHDFFPSKVGDKLFETSNEYERELLTGVEQIHQRGSDDSTILMASTNLYKKVLQKEYPEDPSHWCPESNNTTRKLEKDHQTKYEIGRRRWMGLPKPFDDMFEAQKVLPPGADANYMMSVDPATKRQVTQNHSLIQILNEWRTKWNLSGQYADCTYDDIIKDMADIQPHVRLKAISMIGKAAEFKATYEELGSLSTSYPDSLGKSVPEHVFVALGCLLNDSNEEVKRAAAITLYALDHPVPKAEEVMQKALHSEASLERWTAAQCLAHYGICDSEVVDEVIKQILQSEEPVKHEKGFALLARMSKNTTLVHSMVAEQLNSSSWRHRVIACKMFPVLYGNINKDVTHKLSEMMWHDWNEDVRQAAAQCLGKTSHGQHVHDDILRCIAYGSERVKLEAISRIGQLGIMTAKLLPAFLECFHDQYMSIRCECCITSGNLKITDEQVMSKLVHLATFDPIWKVKALAIQALGKVGVVTTQVKECLLWALSYENNDAVRAEACHSLVGLNMLDDTVVALLQERLLVESSQMVQDEMVEALRKMGVAATEDMNMVAQIKKEVRKLCIPTVIASQIVLDEADEMRQNNLANMVYMSEAEIEQKQIECKSLSGKRPQVIAQASPTELRFKESKFGKSPSKLESITSEPISREGTLYTPTADKEIEAILSREDVSSSVPSASSTEIKSRPVTEETVTSGTRTPLEGISREPSTHELSFLKDELEDDRASTAFKTTHSRFSQVSTSRLGPTPSLVLPALQKSQSDFMHTSSQRIVMSAESLQEREKMNERVKSTYDDLSARYVGMIEDILKVDKGLSTSHSSGSQLFLTVPAVASHKSSPSHDYNSTDANDHVLVDIDYCLNGKPLDGEFDEVFDQASSSELHIGKIESVSASREDIRSTEVIQDEAMGVELPVPDMNSHGDPAAGSSQ